MWRRRRVGWYRLRSFGFDLRHHEYRPFAHAVGGENGNIGSAWNQDAKLFALTLFLKIAPQPEAELAGIVPDNIVFAGVVARTPSEDMDTDLMLADLGGSARDLAFTYI
jgi:hypothetical protein